MQLLQRILLVATSSLIALLATGTAAAATPAGSVTEFSAGIGAAAGLGTVAAGPDGNLWFTESSQNRIGRITPSGVVTEFAAGITPGAAPAGIAAGPDGNMWFTESGSAPRIGRITSLGVVTEFATGISALARLGSIAAGSDGNLWFTELDGNRIGRITPGGAVQEFQQASLQRQLHPASLSGRTGVCGSRSAPQIRLDESPVSASLRSLPCHSRVLRRSALPRAKTAICGSLNERETRSGALPRLGS